ncbi:choice-of-anchor I family protein [Polymorphobacter sp.]|uniref:choice-of-anchor I family protein n=1 Tax=Polymorphobacter sp. TaxID=1909290 RepID=UPI003F7193DF
MAIRTNGTTADSVMAPGQAAAAALAGRPAIAAPTKAVAAATALKKKPEDEAQDPAPESLDDFVADAKAEEGSTTLVLASLDVEGAGMNAGLADDADAPQDTAGTDGAPAGAGAGVGGGGDSTLLYALLGAAAAGGGIALVASGGGDDEPRPDTTAPAAPTGLDLAAADDSGTSNTDNLTSVTTGLTITGSAEPGATVQLFDGTTSLGSTTATSTGSFSLDVTLPTGARSITARATDAAGNASPASAALVITVDTSTAAPTGLDLAAADDTGASNSDNITSTTTALTITGTAEAGASVQLFDGTTSLGTVTAGSNGTFSLDVTLPAGARSITARATDTAGNVSTPSTALVVTVDATAPAAPTGLDLAAADDTGVSDSDNITRNTTALTITGTAEAGASVQLFDGTTSLGTTTAGSNGTFSLDVTLAAGVRSVTAVATDVAGNVGAASAPLAITVDTTAPAAPVGLDLAAVDDTGVSNSDNITDQTEGLTISGTAAAGSRVELFDGATSLGTVTAGSDGAFSLDVALAAGDRSITARATDAAGNVSAASSALVVTVSAGPTLLNASIDALGDVITLYFDEALDMASTPLVTNFTVMQDTSITVTDFNVAGNRVTLRLSQVLAADGDVTVSYNGTGLTDTAGNAAAAFAPFDVTNRLEVTGNRAINFGATATLELGGAEISAFDPDSNRIFVTSGGGLQVVSMDADLNLTLLGTITLGSNNISSVTVSNGIVAVAVIAADKTQPGSVFFLAADGDVADADMVLGSVLVGANPDMVTFTPDGSKILVANEGELDEEGNDPEGSVSIIDMSGGVANATVTTAGFAAFNDRLDALKAAGVRLFAGEEGFETTTVAQDLEPEYIAVSADGTRALITLQENNAVAILDIASATITDIVPLGLKGYEHLLVDFVDRGGINLTRDNPVFGQFMPDSISSFTGSDDRTYFVMANEGDDRDDFLPEFLDIEEAARISSLDLDPTVFPNAATLQTATVLGRHTVSNAPGNNGDLDGDGDIDRLLSYGARSFSIIDENGTIIFDSASHIEQFMALGGAFDGPGTGLFDDTRSDNKGPEPEGITTGVFGDSVLAFVAIERGGGGVMIYDVTDPRNVQFVQYVRGLTDISPEGLVYISAADSPTGEATLLVSNEVSNTLTAITITPATTYTLQLLHFADGEAGLLAAQTAPNMAALIDAFEDDYVNSITLSGGDSFIPGPFFAAGADPSITSVLPGGNTQGRVDIAIHNAMGVQASAIGNHEFDFGSDGFVQAFAPSGAWVGAQFPFVSANLDFSGDSSLNPRFTQTLGVNGLEDAANFKGRVVPSAIIKENGENIGIVGVTTQLLEQISSPTGTEVKGFPTGPGANGEADNMALLASQLQPYIDDLVAQGVNKIILLSHLQLIGNEEALAPLLSGIDIIVAAGSNTRLGDADDVAVAFPGHAADFADTYPILTEGADELPTLIVNTDNEYTYLGRLVVDFDSNGVIITENLEARVSINGAYASTAENVAMAWGVDEADLDTTAFADGTRGAAVRALTDAVQNVIDIKSSVVYGYSDVYLEGARAAVRNQETNLGSVSADANADAARDALGLTPNDVIVSLKNGGGIRSQIGTVSAPKEDGTVDFLPNVDGVVSQLDVENSLRFDNGLMVFDTTPQGLLNILNNPAATTPNNGGFFQLGGVQVSYDPTRAAGDRIRDIALVDELGNKVAAIADDGVVVDGAPATITVVTLNFTANGGDGYAIKANGSNFRYLLDDGTVSAPVDSSLDFTAAGVVPANIIGEQQAFAEYFEENFGTPELAFDLAETSQAFDLRIQNQQARDDTVLDGLLMTVEMTMMVQTLEFA